MLTYIFNQGEDNEDNKKDEGIKINTPQEFKAWKLFTNKKRR